MAGSVNEREIALETLLLITKEGEYSHIALKQVLDKYQYLEKRERAFITRVVEGTLERMIELDEIINQFSKVKVNKMKPVIKTILRSSVYQLKYMDGVPNSAVCNEAVKLAVKKGFGSLKGFVNGVLRNISRNLEHLEFPYEKDSVKDLSVRLSLPEWLVEMWMKEYDSETVKQIGNAFLEKKRTSIRCNTARIQPEELKKILMDEGVCAEEHEEIEEAFFISGYDYLAKLPSFQKGYFYIQDISSMQVAKWAAPKKGNIVLDVCAAPGGKAIHIAEKLDGTGMVTARDLTERKVDLLEENMERCGLSNIRAEQWDATEDDPSWHEKADIVIADLPCSGLGVLGRKPDLRYKMTPEMLVSLTGLQRQILNVVQAYVKPGGKLVYSTCTIHKKENEENVQWFLENHPEFTCVKQRQNFPGYMTGDGFFLALLEKKGES